MNCCSVLLGFRVVITDTIYHFVNDIVQPKQICVRLRTFKLITGNRKKKRFSLVKANLKQAFKNTHSKRSLINR